MLKFLSASSLKLATIFAALSLTAANAQTQKQFSSSVVPISAMDTSMMQSPFVAPLFVEDGEFTSTLILANGTAVPTYADIALRTLDGKTVATQTIQFQPHSVQQVSIRALRETGTEPNITTGSVVVSQTPSANGMTVLGALSITQLSTGSSHYVDQILAKPGYIDQELAMPSDASSLTLRGVADGSDGSPLVAITSLNKMAQHVTVTCLSGNQAKSTKLTLAPEQTVLMSVCDPDTKRDADLHWYVENLPLDSHGPAGIELTSDGAPGSFAAYGLALHDTKQGKYFSSVAFADPKMLVSTTAVFTGVPVGPSELLSTGTYTPVLSLANFSPSPRQVSVKYALTRDGAASLSTIASVTLAPLSTQEVVLSGLNGDSLLRDSFLVESDGRSEDVLTKLVSKSGGPLHEVELLAKDLNDPENGGNHPWTVEGGTTSTLLLFNQSDKPQWFNVKISAGATVWQKSYQLQPKQTEAIGINDLIKTGAEDNHGNVFPKDIWAGQVGWSVARKSAGRGRLLQSNPNTAMARSFSCGWILELCDADLNIANQVIGITETMLYGNMGNFQVCMNSCYGSPVGGGEAYEYNFGWSSYNSNVASIASWDTYGDSNVYGAGAGGTNIGGWAADPYCSVNVAGPVNISLCQVPTGESTAYVRQVLTGQVSPTASDFLQTLSIPPPGTPSGEAGATVSEAEGQAGTDSCWWSGSPYPPFNSVTGGNWVVGGITPGFAESQVVVPGPGQWGPDEVGFAPGPVKWYQQNNPPNGRTLPCGAALYQSLSLACPSKNSVGYVYNSPLSTTIDSTGITNCRAGVCASHYGYQ